MRRCIKTRHKKRGKRVTRATQGKPSVGLWAPLRLRKQDIRTSENQKTRQVDQTRPTSLKALWRISPERCSIGAAAVHICTTACVCSCVSVMFVKCCPRLHALAARSTHGAIRCSGASFSVICGICNE